MRASSAYGQAAANGSAATVAPRPQPRRPAQAQPGDYLLPDGRPVRPITGALRGYPGRAVTIVAIRASVGTAPVGQAVIVDVNKNGSTIFTTQSNRPAIAAGTLTDLADAINIPNVSAGEFLTVDIDQAGTTTPGRT